MSRIAYVNGQYCRQAQAGVSIDDRGYQFADGVYEVALYVNGQFWDLDGHLARLTRSLAELRIDMPVSGGVLCQILERVVARNHFSSALLYIQVTRGVAKRSHAFPTRPVRPSLIVTASPYSLDASDDKAAGGIKVVSRPDQRWGRVDIKTTNLLPNCLARQSAAEQGAQEAVLVRDDHITEGSASNFWIITQEGTLVTHPLSNEILGGVTRATAIESAQLLQLKVEERPFTLDEVKHAKEAFVTAATVLAMPVVSFDGTAIGDGTPGPITLQLRELYKQHAPQNS